MQACGSVSIEGETLRIPARVLHSHVRSTWWSTTHETASSGLIRFPSRRLPSKRCLSTPRRVLDAWPARRACAPRRIRHAELWVAARLIGGLLKSISRPQTICPPSVRLSGSCAGTAEGDARTRSYNAQQREGTVRLAMIGQLQRPPKGFEDVVRRHFYLRRA